MRGIRPIVVAAAFLAVLSTASLPAQSAPAGAEGPRSEESLPTERLLVVEYFNDWEGRLEPFPQGASGEVVGGASRIATLLESRRSLVRGLGGDSLFLLAGDTIGGSLLSSLTGGRAEIEVLNQLRLDATTLGSHDLGLRREKLRRLLNLAHFPVLAANTTGLLDEDSADLPTCEASAGKIVAACKVSTASGLEVAILGLVHPDLRRYTLAKHRRGLEIRGPVEEARRRISTLVEQSDAVVVLSHCGLRIDRELARVRGVDLVVGGFDHQLLDPPVQTEGAAVVQAFRWGEYVGEATLSLAGNTYLRDNAYFRVTDALAEDPVVDEILAGFRRTVDPEIERARDRLGGVSLPTRLDGDREAIRSRSTNFGNLVADAMRHATPRRPFDVALINSGAIRSSIEEGPVTHSALYRALPFPDHLVVVRLRGSDLLRVLDRSAGHHKYPPGGGFLQVSGLTMRVHDGRVEDVWIGDDPIDPDRRYSVAVSDFLYGGGDGYELSGGRRWPIPRLSLIELVTRHLRRLGERAGLDRTARVSFE